MGRLPKSHIEHREIACAILQRILVWLGEPSMTRSSGVLARRAFQTGWPRLERKLDDEPTPASLAIALRPNLPTVPLDIQAGEIKPQPEPRRRSLSTPNPIEALEYSWQLLRLNAGALIRDGYA